MLCLSERSHPMCSQKTGFGHVLCKYFPIQLTAKSASFEFVSQTELKMRWTLTAWPSLRPLIHKNSERGFRNLSLLSDSLNYPNVVSSKEIWKIVWVSHLIWASARSLDDCSFSSFQVQQCLLKRISHDFLFKDIVFRKRNKELEFSLLADTWLEAASWVFFLCFMGWLQSEPVYL